MFDFKEFHEHFIFFFNYYMQNRDFKLFECHHTFKKSKMSRTSYYVSLYGGNTTVNPSSTMYNDDLFSSISPKDRKSIINITHKKILKWLQECSDTTPDLMNGMNESIVDWFLQSAHLLPDILHLSPKPDKSDTISNFFEEESTEIEDFQDKYDQNLYKSEILSTDIVNAIKILIQNHCLTKDTRTLLKNSINSIPPPEIVWRILEDLHSFSLKKTNVTVPLTRTKGAERPIVFQRNIINKFLQKLHLPLLTEDTPSKSYLDDPFKNGQLFIDIYNALTGDTKTIKLALSPPQAQSNVEIALNLLIQSFFIDESFSKCAANIVNGDMFLIQRIISLVMCNATEIKSPKRSFKQTPNLLLREQDEDYDIDDKKKKTDIIFNNDNASEKSKKSQEKVFVKGSKISDGISLVKLLTVIDPDFSNVECLFAKPANEIEKKWNIRKSLEFLYKKSDWPRENKVDSSLLYSGEFRATNSLYNGLTTCYKNKFSSLATIINLKNMLGLDTTKI